MNQIHHCHKVHLHAHSYKQCGAEFMLGRSVYLSRKFPCVSHLMFSHALEFQSCTPAHTDTHTWRRNTCALSHGPSVRCSCDRLKALQTSAVRVSLKNTQESQPMLITCVSVHVSVLVGCESLRLQAQRACLCVCVHAHPCQRTGRAAAESGCSAWTLSRVQPKHQRTSWHHNHPEAHVHTLNAHPSMT